MENDSWLVFCWWSINSPLSFLNAPSLSPAFLFLVNGLVHLKMQPIFYGTVKNHDTWAALHRHHQFSRQFDHFEVNGRVDIGSSGLPQANNSPLPQCLWSRILFLNVFHIPSSAAATPPLGLRFHSKWPALDISKIPLKALDGMGRVSIWQELFTVNVSVERWGLSRTVAVK